MSSQPNKKQTLPTVADYVAAQVAMCGKTQAEIARDAGFKNPNMISMIKTGATQLPLERIAGLARSLGVDSLYLLKICMSQYQAGTWAVFQRVIGQPFLTENELEFVEALRKTKLNNPKLGSEENKQKFVQFVEELCAEQPVV